MKRTPAYFGRAANIDGVNPVFRNHLDVMPGNVRLAQVMTATVVSSYPKSWSKTPMG